MIKGILLTLAVLLVLGTIITISSCERIDAGHEGILIKKFGSGKGVQNDITLVTGYTFINPFTEKVEEFPLFVQTLDYPEFNINSKDGSVFTIDPTISYNVIPGKSPVIYSKYRVDIETISKSTLFNYVKDSYRIMMNKYTTDELISKREVFENSVQLYIDSIFRKDGFALNTLTSGLKYPNTLIEVINQKNQSVQYAMKYENDLKIAEARAKIKLIEAEAESKANQLKQQSLTPLLIQKMFIDKWSGESPLYSNSPSFFKNIN